jgi:hypothetical protein
MIGLVIEKHLFLFRPNTNRPTYLYRAAKEIRTLSSSLEGWRATIEHHRCFNKSQKRTMSGRPGSNWPPQPWQGCALPNELLPQEWTR